MLCPSKVIICVGIEKQPFYILMRYQLCLVCVSERVNEIQRNILRLYYDFIQVSNVGIVTCLVTID